MKRARDRWGLRLFVGVLTVSLFASSEAVRATSLIFRTTTTTTTEAPELEEGAETEASAVDETTPGTNLTGIPQIDYIHDPNLPRELNGYNLSSYPFYETVPPPEEMDFKCDGLHDGFYASVPHKCQVYHHCLYGTRYDFLCANYTAFDQKTFICHFVSEVDCVNSPKYYIRNEALYKSLNDTELEEIMAKISATTKKPPFDYEKYFATTPPWPNKKKTSKMSTIKPKTSKMSTMRPKTTKMPKIDIEIEEDLELTTPRVLKNRLRFATTVAPMLVKDYYDIEYVDPLIATKVNKKKGNEALYKATTTSTVAPPTTTTTTTTPAPPPPRRPSGHRRRPSSRRRRPQHEYYDDEDDYYPTVADDEDYYEDDRRYYNEGRSSSRRRKPRPRPSQRRPAYDEYEDRYERRPDTRTRYDEDDRRSYERPRKPQGRRPSDDREKPDDRPQYSDEDRPYDRNRKNRPSEEKRMSEYDRRPMAGEDNKRDRRPSEDRRPTYEDEPRSYERPRRPPSREETTKEVPKEDERPFREERPMREKPFRDERPHRENHRPQNERRPVKNEPVYDDEEPFYDDDYKENKKTEIEGLVKPVGSSIYSKPRLPPKIARPVPSNEKEKYKYVTSSTTTTKQPLGDEEYYDDYVEEYKNVPTPKPAPKTRPESAIERTGTNSESESIKRTTSFKSQRRPSQEAKETKKTMVFSDEASYEDFDDLKSKKPTKSRVESEDRYSSRRRPTSKVEEDYYYDEQEPRLKKGNENKHSVPSKSEDERLPVKTEKEVPPSTTKPFFHRNKPTEATTTTTTTTTVANDFLSKEEKSEPKPHVRVRVGKRPFLPSRGGNPYLPRGLQPLGGKHFNTTATIIPSTTITTAIPSTSTTLTTTTTTTTTTIPPTTSTEAVSQPDYFYDTDYDDKEYPKASQEYVNRDDSSKEYVDKTPDRDYSSDERHTPPPPPPPPPPQLSKSFFNYQKPSTESYSSREKFTKHSNLPNFRQDPKNDYKAPDDHTFKPSPERYKPTNKPYPLKIPENISIKANLADSVETDYDVTLNDALNPTLPNLPPIRSFPSPFIVPADRDYTFSRYRNPGYQADSSAAGSASYAHYNQRPTPSRTKYDNTQRYVGYNSREHQDPLASASSLVNPSVVSVRTPQSFFIRPPRYPNAYLAEETNSGLGHVVTYRHVNLGDYS